MNERVPRRGVDGTIIEWLDVPARAVELHLEPHPEGGWYRRTWASAATVDAHGGTRPAATMILFLLPPGESSAWHVVTSDELWLWHGPGAVRIQHGGAAPAPDAGETCVLDAANPQVLVPAGNWQRTLPAETETLVSCVVSPGFSFDDFTLAD
ncbi:cupin domain-containing protein [Microbacterium gorillae]|uniref:cupin domain-containing protein n=1 Tax=Microbacterium gorillae TaxID=1231063 RepID=UPI000AEF72BC|nr:cupin domain-containing protein [Microbacterium gorillae]